MRIDDCGLDAEILTVNRLFTQTKDKTKLAVKSRTHDGRLQAAGYDYVEPFTLSDGAD